jgi:hypothetical protein
MEYYSDYIDYSDKYVKNELLSKYVNFNNLTLKEKQEHLEIYNEEYTLEDKYKIIIYFTKNNDLQLLLYIKYNLYWDFDFYFKIYTYPILCIVYSKTLEDIKFYFETLKVDFDYSIKKIISKTYYPGRFSIPVEDLLYNAINNTIIYDFNMFKYIFDKVIENNPLSNIYKNHNMLYNIINCNNIEFIEYVINKYSLDINYINPYLSVSPLLFGFERCSLDTILFLNKKYNSNIFKSIKESTYKQEYIIDQLFTHLNDSEGDFKKKYILPESERENIFKYIIKFLNNNIINYTKKLLLKNKSNINYDIYINIIKIYEIGTCFSNNCSSCNEKIIKKNNDVFYISEDNSYHSHCCDKIKTKKKIYINNCSICLNNDINEFIILNCGHMICINCITEYKKYKQTCCYCREKLTIVGYIKM